MTGVTHLADLVAAPVQVRPTYIARDLRGLLEPHAAPERVDRGWRCGGWITTVADGQLEVTGQGATDDWWRAVAAASWTHLDDGGSPVEATDVQVPGDDEWAGRVPS